MSKSVSYYGQRRIKDVETGEEFEADYFAKRHTNAMNSKTLWRRVILSDLMASIQCIGNQKLKVLEYIISIMNKNNEINTTYKDIQENTGVAIQTITATFKALKESNLIKKHNNLYVMNCQIASSIGDGEKTGC